MTRRTSSCRTPPLHPHAAALLEASDLPSFLPDGLDDFRLRNQGDPDELLDAGLERSDVEVAGPRGPIPVSLWRRAGDEATGPCWVFLHGGGQCSGDRFGAGDMVDIVTAHGGTLVTPSYRLTPEHPAPAGVEDCLAVAGWAQESVEDCLAVAGWAQENATSIGADPERMFLAGTSAGGGLAAGVLLLGREHGGPDWRGAWLNCPMLDDRNGSTSVQQFWTTGLFWDRLSNQTGWAMALSGLDGDVPEWVAPARAGWLGDLPPILLTVGECEPFRDEVVAFASALWRDGTSCQLLVVPGGIHSYASATPDADITALHRDVVARWFASRLHPDTAKGAAAAIEALAESEREVRRRSSAGG